MTVAQPYRQFTELNPPIEHRRKSWKNKQDFKNISFKDKDMKNEKNSLKKSVKSTKYISTGALWKLSDYTERLAHKLRANTIAVEE